jgi:hypothetical protein
MSETDIGANDGPEGALLARLAELRLEHQDLDDAVRLLSQTARPDQIQIARLKKKKLFLKDMIARLEDQLTPDIIA